MFLKYECQYRKIMNMNTHKFGDQPQIDFCYECRKDTEYRVDKKITRKKIKDVIYPFAYTVAICTECGKEMSPPSLIDKNIEEFEQQCKYFGIPLSYQLFDGAKTENQKDDFYNANNKAVDPSEVADYID